MTTNRKRAPTDDKRFWDIIAVACKHDVKGSLTSERSRALVEQLVTLPPDLIVRFDRWFDHKTDALYTTDHWGAAYLINGGASDDGFYYWRCWLVGMGKKVYEAALANPDSLADVVSPDQEDEAEIYSAARSAWDDELRLAEEAFDKVYESLGPPRNPKLKGKRWDYDDDREVRKRFPRLAALYLDAEEE